MIPLYFQNLEVGEYSRFNDDYIMNLGDGDFSFVYLDSMKNVASSVGRLIVVDKLPAILSLDSGESVHLVQQYSIESSIADKVLSGDSCDSIEIEYNNPSNYLYVNTGVLFNGVDEFARGIVEGILGSTGKEKIYIYLDDEVLDFQELICQWDGVKEPTAAN